MWIRSQDKTVLVKVFDFRVDCCIGLDGEYYIQGNLDSNYDSYILGTYKSKERAIEVLDEIQTCISNFFEYEVMPPQNNDWFFSVQAVPRTNKIYNMPEE